MTKAVFRTLLKYLLAFSLLALVIYFNWTPKNGKGLGYVWDRHVVQGVPIHWQYLAIAFAINLIALAATVVRWFLLVRAQDLPFTLPAAFRLGLIGVFYNAFLPGAVGGDIVKAAVLTREQSRRTVAVATVIMDRAIALWALIWFVTLIGGAFWAGGVLEGDAARAALPLVSTTACILAGTVLVWVLLGFLPPHRAERFADRLSRLPVVGHSAAEFWRAVWMYRNRSRSVALALVLSWIAHAGLAAMIYCCALATWDGAADNPIPTLADHFLIVPVGLVILAVPGFPGGAGFGELGFGLLYEWFGSNPANGILAALLRRVLEWVIGITGYLCVRSRPLPQTLPLEETTEAGPGDPLVRPSRPELVEG